MDLLDTNGAARRLNMAPGTLENLRCRGEGPRFLKLGRVVRYDPKLLDEWLAERVFQSTSEAAA